MSAGAWVKRLLPDLPVALCGHPAAGALLPPGRRVAVSDRPFPGLHLQGSRRGRCVLRHARVSGHGREGRPARRPRVDPDSTIGRIDDDYRTIVRRFLRDHIPALADAPIGFTEVCLYTVAPDEQFQVDFLPGRPDVIVASPCSGHGFKFSCLIGRVLADLAIAGKTDLPVDYGKSPGAIDETAE